MIEPRLLRYFVAVAESEHVGRAAAALHVSQSPLSRQIRGLEEQLGVELFHRERQRLRLTDAGRALLPHARDLLGRGAELEDTARRLARGERGLLRVGFVGAAVWTERLPRAMRRMRETHADVRLELSHRGSQAQLTALRQGQLDVALTHRSLEVPELHATLLLREKTLVALPGDDARARKRRLDGAALDGAPFIAVGEGGRARLHAAAARAGFAADVVAEVADFASALALVAAGVGATLVPASLGQSRPRGVVLRESASLAAPTRLYLVRRATGVTAALEAFARHLTRG